MGTYTAEVQKLYIAYFNRPADTAGLAYWEGQLNSGVSMATVQNGFSSSAEYQSIYSGKANLVLINTLYQNLFGREAEPAGLLYWAGEMSAGRQTITSIAGALASGTTAGSADNVAIISKITAASSFTDGLVTTAQIIGYTNTSAFATASAWLAPVTNSTTLATAASSLTTTIASAVTAGSSSTGSTFTLTTGVDVKTLSDGNDTFTAVVNNSAVAGQTSSLTAGDSLVGGNGTDTLSVIDSATGVQTVQGFFLNGVEKVSVEDVSTAGVQTFDLGNATGLTTVAVTASASAAGTVFTNLANIVDTEVTNSTGNVTTTYAASVVTGAADAVKVTLSGAATTADASFTADKIETLNVVTSGAATGNATNGFEVTLTGDSVKTLNVSGATAAVIKSNLTGATGLSTTTAGTLNAATATGAMDVDLTGAAGTYLNATAGTGNDTIRVNALNTNMTIAGGNGTDTLRVTSLAGGTNDFKNVSGFEKIAFAATVTAAQDLTNAGTINEVTLVNGSTGAGGASGVSSGVTLNYVAAAGGADAYALTVTNATTSTTDVVNVNVGSATTTANIAAGTLTASGVETINLVSNSKAEIAAGNHTIAITDTSLKTLNISGNESLVVTGGTTTLTSVDASKATASVNVSGLTLNALTVTVQGGAGNDTLAGAAGNDSLVGGSGNDLITAGAGNDVVSGGDGNDTLVSGGTGNDSFDAGAGNDRIVFAAAELTSADTVSGGDGTNTLVFSNTLAGNALVDTAFKNVTGITTITAAASAVTATANDGADNATGTLEMTLNTAAQAAGVTTVAAQFNATTGATTGTNAIVATVQEGFTNALTFKLGDIAGADNINAGATTGSITVSGNEGSFDAADTLVGGSSANDTLVITANNQVNGGAVLGNGGSTTNVSGFESVVIKANATTPTATASLTINSDAILTSGKSLTVDASALTTDTANFTFDGSQEVADATVANTGRFNVTSGAGADIITGGAGNDTVSSGAGSDLVNAGSGNDSVDAGAGADTVNGAAGNDTLVGGTGNDVLTGGSGADSLVGGDGNDIFNYGATTGNVAAGAATDSVVLDNATQSSLDTISGFNAGDGTLAGVVDKIRLPGAAVGSQITTVTVGSANLTTFATDLAASGNLNTALANANDVAVVTVTSGTAAGTYLVVNTGGVAGFNATTDLVIKMVDSVNLANLSLNNFQVATVNAFNQLTNAQVSPTFTADGDALTVASAVTASAVAYDLLGGANTVTLQTGANIGGATYVATGGSVSYIVDGTTAVTMSRAQNALISSATGAANNVTLSDAGAATGNAAVETYTLASGANTFTIGSTTQNVTAAAGGGVTTINVAGTLGAATYTGQGANDVLSLATGSNIAAATVGADFVGLTVATGGSVTMTRAQNNAFTGAITAAGTGAGGETITISDTGAVTALANIENYTLAAAGNNITVLAGTNVTGGAAADTVTVTGLTATGTYTGLAAADTISIVGTSSLASVNAGAATGAGILAIDNAATTVSMTQAQHAGFAATGDAGITGANAADAITVTTAGAVVTDKDIATYSVVEGSTVTVGTVAGNLAQVITETGAVGTVSTFTLGSGIYTGVWTGIDATDVVKVGTTTDVSANTGLNAGVVIDFQNTATVGAGLTLNATQNGVVTFNNTTGIQAITLSATDSGYTTDAGIEVYNLVGVANSLTLGVTGQTINGVAVQDDTVNTGALTTLTGTTLALNTGTDVLVVTTNNTNLSGINAGAATTAETLTVNGLTSTTLTAAQLAAFITINATGTGGTAETLNVSTQSTGGSAITVAAGVETYVFQSNLNDAVTFAAGAGGTGFTGTINLTAGGVDTVALTNAILNAGQYNNYATISGFTATAGVNQDVITSSVAGVAATSFVTLTGAGAGGAAAQRVVELEVAATGGALTDLTNSAQVTAALAAAITTITAGSGTYVLYGQVGGAGAQSAGIYHVTNTGSVGDAGGSDFTAIELVAIIGSVTNDSLVAANFGF